MITQEQANTLLTMWHNGNKEEAIALADKLNK